MRSPTRTLVTAFAISAALLVAGCSGDSGNNASADKGELFLQPVAEVGPDPFTDSTATSTETPAPVTRTPQPPSPRGTATATTQGMRPVDGATPGLYGGTQSVGSCDVEKQVAFLTSDPTKERAFAEAAGISATSVPGFLRGLTPVVLRADTRVTNHGYRSGEATSYQSVLQAGTAVLVDARGLPRVRCACGNPLAPPVAFKGTPNTQGQEWSGYQPTKVVVVTPAPKAITNIVIVNITNNTWIERKVGDDGQHDKRVPPPPMPKPNPSDSSTSPPPSSTSPSSSSSPSESSSSASPPSSQPRSSDESAPPSAGESAPASEPAGPSTSAPGDTDTPPDSPPSDGSSDLGPDTVPDSPDQPDGSGLIPDKPSAENVLDS
ncbi:hypothetical protein OG698_06890 [Streptomyces sp. NBC_01003]|uniref:DUF6777 domain-containing protein n=1 Tax=Streptomyces sp. NBC_01003 TaxID=2903714 RepID=UPI00386BCDA2|nr:hypothetical protein OG698_06890 [Streptomyces sp. NBC_01003]